MARIKNFSTFAWFVADATVSATAGDPKSLTVAQVDDGITAGDTITVNLAFAAVEEGRVNPTAAISGENPALPTYATGTPGNFADVALTNVNGVNLGYLNGGTVPGNSTQWKYGVAKVVVTLSQSNANMTLEQSIKSLAADAVFTVTLSTPAPDGEIDDDATPTNPANHARVHKAAPTVTTNGYVASATSATITLNHSDGTWSIAAVSGSSVTNTNEEKSLKFYYSTANALDTAETVDNHTNDVIKATVAA